MFAVLQVADFPLQAVLRLEQGLHARPAALIVGEQRSQAIGACNAAARAAGVMLGQTVPQALARCDRLVVRAVDLPAEAEARASLVATAFSVSPSVELTAPGVCTLAVAGLDPAQRESALAAAMAKLSRLGLEATAGLGATPLLALYAARRTESLLVVRDGATFLAPLPLAAADPSPGVAGILAGWGIRTLGELTALSKADLTHRLGPEGLALYERATGEVSRPLHLLAPAQSFTAGIECEYELETLEPVLFLLRRFVDRLALELENAGFAARELALTLSLADEKTHRHSIRLPEATTQPDILFRTLHSYLESVHTEAAVVGVTLEIEPTRITTRQQGLFDSALRDPHGFSETLARVTALVGPGRVGTPLRVNTHRPDAFTLVTPSPTLPSLAAGFCHPALGLALRRFRPALPATVELAEGKLSYVWTGEIRGSVRAFAGPWYGSGDWWQADRKWEREEWDVELEEGGVYRMFRTPEAWYLEGEYD